MAGLAPLSERIIVALTGPATSADLAGLIAEASADLSSSAARLDALDRTIVDPLSGTEAVNAAMEETAGLALAIRRGQRAIQQLDARLKRAAAEEDRVRRQAKRDEALKLHEAAAAAFRERYPLLAGELASLMRQVARADAAVREADAGGPVESVVRGLNANGSHPEMLGIHPRVADLLYLPAMDPREQAVKGPIWAGTAHGSRR